MPSTGTRTTILCCAVALGALGAWPGSALADLHPTDPQLRPPVRQTAAADKIYIVQLRQPAAISVHRPAAGKRFDAHTLSVQSYSEELTRSHDDVLQSVGGYQNKLYSYRYTFNGFAARLSAVQADKLRGHPDVAGVWEDSTRYLETSDSPRFLGLLDKKGGLRANLKLQGEDVVIGVIDSGIGPAHPSFVDTVDPPQPRVCRTQWGHQSLLGRWLCRRFRSRARTMVYQPAKDWHGRCETGPGFSITDCNNKLIGARFYADGFQQSFELDPNEQLSPLDADGHGTHIASTAAGNNTTASISGVQLAAVSGMAPRARLAIYKACWLEPGATRGSCAMSDLQRAIEDAVADGVDVLSYSIGTPGGTPNDPDALALLAATEAGVLTVVAAGNSGPAAASLESPGTSPWTLAVGGASRAGTRFDPAVRVTAPATVAKDYASKEAVFTPTLRKTGPISSDLVLVDDGVLAISGSTTGTTYDGCESIVNTSKLKGKIAFLQRGSCNFEVKLLNVQTAGAKAAVVFSNTAEAIVMAGTRGAVNIPAVMIGEADGELLLQRLQKGDAVKATLDSTVFLRSADKGNVMGSFSSRGPDVAVPDVLKPDVVAPGVDILAAQTATVANGLRGELFQYLSGTSMAVPHVAGVAALLKEAHPDWSPAALRSALVTTARQDVLKEDAATLTDPFDIGGGYIVPNKAVAPGLVYEAGNADYDAFGCGSGQPAVTSERCAELQAAGYLTGATDLNLPTIGLSRLVSETAIHRRLTNVGAAATYTASIEAPSGVNVSVSPASLSLGAGESADYTLTLRNLGTTPDQWAFGAISWKDAEHAVRSPIAVLTRSLLAPVEVFGSGRSGSLEFPLQFGYSGSYAAVPYGLIPPDPYGIAQPFFIANDPNHNYVPNQATADLPASVVRVGFTVAPGTVLLRVALFNAETDGNDDLDLYLYCPSGQCNSTYAILASGGITSDEKIDILYPESGDYVIDVHGYQTDDANGGPGANFRLFAWAVDGNGQGNFQVVAPGSVSTGDTQNVSVSWQNLEPATRYLGGISHTNGTDTLGFTVLSVTTP